MTTTGRLILVCGLPGAGKTTAAKRLAAEHGPCTRPSTCCGNA